MAKWSEERALRHKYKEDQDKNQRGDYCVWEPEGGGFGLRLYKTGRRTWVQTGSRWDDARNRWVSYIQTLGVVGKMGFKDARTAAEAAKVVKAAEVQESTALADTTLQQAADFYVAERNCEDSSKKDLKSAIKNAGALLHTALLKITSNQLKAAYDAVLKRVQAREAVRVAKVAKLPPEEQLLHAPAGYYNGKKAGDNFVECFERVYNYWTLRHTKDLNDAGIKVPQCPADAIKEDMEPLDRRVKSVPHVDLKKLLKSFKTYEGSPLHPLLVRTLLATGQRVGVMMGCRWSWVQKDRIVIPADAPLGKVRHNKRGLDYMAKVIPLTAAMNVILKELARVGPLYGDAETWLFPSRESKTGHMTEEKAVVKALRKHSGMRFNMHQLRHNVGTIAEDLEYTEAEVKELLGHGQGEVTARYIDDRLKRHHKMLTKIAREFT